MQRNDRPPKCESFHSNCIPLPFGKIVDGMLATKPEKKPAKPKKKPLNK